MRACLSASLPLSLFLLACLRLSPRLCLFRSHSHTALWRYVADSRLAGPNGIEVAVEVQPWRARQQRARVASEAASWRTRPRQPPDQCAARLLPPTHTASRTHARMHARIPHPALCPRYRSCADIARTTYALEARTRHPSSTHPHVPAMHRLRVLRPRPASCTSRTLGDFLCAYQPQRSGQSP